MAEIRFLPVCTNCKTVLDKEFVDIDYNELYGEVFGVCFIEKHLRITPKVCPVCGQEFTSLTIQVKLPFNPQEVAQ